MCYKFLFDHLQFGTYLNAPCSGNVVDSYTLPSYESFYLSYTEGSNPISFDARGVSSQPGNVCVYDSYVNRYYMI
ncbi:MAG: hypothetical protein ACP5UF_01755 [Hydrogenobaculum sp.]